MAAMVVVVIFRSGISFEAAGIPVAKIGDVTALIKAKGSGCARD